MKRVLRARVSAIFLTFLAALAGHATAQNYSLTVVAETGDVIGGKTLTGLGIPSLNNSGQVAFLGGFSGGSGIFTNTSLLVQAGDVLGGKTLTSLGFFSRLNDSGQVAFQGEFSGGSGIFTNTSLLVQTGDALGGKTLTAFHLILSQNNNGEIAFGGSFSDGSGIFTQSSIEVQTGDVIGGKSLTSPTFAYIPSVNDSGLIAFYGEFYDDNTSISQGIFTQTSLLAKTGDTIGGKTLTDFDFFPSLNNSGEIAFQGFFLGGSAIFTQHNIVVQGGDTIGGLTLQGVFSPTLNDSGVVAFMGWFPGGMGIFTQNGLVVKTGDVVEEKTLSAFGSPALNDNGQIAFVATFSDGNQSIVLATPTVPMGFAISGKVTSGASNLEGVVMQLSGAASQTTTTGSDGKYTFLGLANGQYTITPSKPGYTFSPSSLPAQVSSGNVSGKDFTASFVGGSYAITGRVTSGGSGLEGVTLKLSGDAARTVTTDGTGTYAFSSLPGGQYTVTPSRSGYTFSPVSLPVTVSNENVPNQDFAATQTSGGYTVSGRVTSGDAGLPGVQINIAGDYYMAGLQTNANGDYSFPGMANGQYTVTPSMAGYTFSPASLPVQVNNDNVPSQNFTATPVVSTYTISGTVTSGGSGLEGVRIDLTGAAPLNTATDANGYYSFTGLANGQYTITPSKAGYSFTPLSLSVQINDGSVVGVNFTATLTTTFSLSVTKSGTGSGTVSSNPAGIDCGTDCSESYSPGTEVSLTATPAQGSTFAGWTGGGCSGTGACTVTMNANKTVTANFTSGYILTVTKQGSGTGTVSSNPAGIDCGTDCSESYSPGTEVSLTATPAQGSTFAGWTGGGCSGTNTCAVTMNVNTTVTAVFNPAIGTYTISGTVTRGGAGLEGVRIDLTGAAPLNTATDANGYYSFTGLANGDYTVTPSRSGYTFSPTSLPVSINNGPMPNQDFTATATGTQIVRTLVSHQLTNDTAVTFSRYPKLSYNGNIIAYRTNTENPRIYHIRVVNFDGLEEREIDAIEESAELDISADGSKIVHMQTWTNGVPLPIRLAFADGSQPETLISVANKNGLRISGDGEKVFFALDGDRTSGTGLQMKAGIWMIPSNGGAPQSVVLTDQVAQFFGVTADKVGWGEPGGQDWYLEVSSDGSHIIFAVHAGDDNPTVNGNEHLLGVNLDGTGLHKVLPDTGWINQCAISPDGSKVAYIVNLTGKLELGVINWDGSGSRVSLASQDDFSYWPWGGVEGRLTFSQDNSKLLFTGFLFDTVTGKPLQVAAQTGGNWESYRLLGDGMAYPSMNSSANRFVFEVNNGVSNVATLEINPPSLGQAPGLTNPMLDPPYIRVGSGGGESFFSVNVTTGDTLYRPGVRILSDQTGRVDPNVAILCPFSECSKDQGGGVWRGYMWATQDAVLGSRTVRMGAEVSDGSGKHHVTQLDVQPFEVVADLPTFSLSVAISGSGTVSSNPAGIDCGPDCSETYSAGTKVSLTATPAQGSTFAGWSGGGCSGTGACTVTLNANTTVTAAFQSLGITVKSPNGGETWQAGTAYTIQWTYTGNPGTTVQIDLLKGGVFNRTITSGTSVGSGGNGSFSWSIPLNQASGADYRIMISSTTVSGCNDTSDNNFTIASTQKPNLTPYKPEGWSGKIVVSNKTGTHTGTGPFYTTDTLYLDWAVINNGKCTTAGTLYHDLYLDGDKQMRWQTLDPVAPNSYRSVADYPLGSLSAGTHTLRIVVDSTGVVEESNESDNEYTKTITVNNPSITVTSPDGGEVWQAGTSQEITWTYKGNPGKVKIQLIKGGNVQKTLSSSVPVGSGGKGSFTWRIARTQTPRNNYKIRITSTTIGTCRDTSNSIFSITAR